MLEDDPNSTLYHREGGPAVIEHDADRWYDHGMLHRTDGPAVIHTDGDVERVEYVVGGQVMTEAEFRRRIGEDDSDTSHSFRFEGAQPLQNLKEPWEAPTAEYWVAENDPSSEHFHRFDGGPAVTYEGGARQWWKDGKCHREGGLPAQIHADGTMDWMENGVPHREGGPAFVGADGSVEYCVRGQWHRLDGPAVINPDGTEEFWWRNRRQTSLANVRSLEAQHRERVAAEERYWEADEGESSAD